MSLSRRARRGPAGQGLVEYALLLVLIAVLAIGSLSLFGGGINGVVDAVGAGS